jgi:hypothetical protein
VSLRGLNENGLLGEEKEDSKNESKNCILS